MMSNPNTVRAELKTRASRSPVRHCEPFDAACGGAQDKLPLRGSEAIQRKPVQVSEARWIASSLRSSQ
jgi:hypothetical protein